MNYDVVTTVEPDHLRLNVAGDYSFDHVFDFIDLVKSEAEKAGRKKVLIDCTKLTVHMTEAERFQGGQRIAQILGSRIQTAVVLPSGQVTKLGEMAAVNRGAKLLVTDSIEEAERWLFAASAGDNV